MKVVVEIGTIAVDGLSEGVDVAALRPAITAALESRIRRGGVRGAHPVRSVSEGAAADGLRGGLDRSSETSRLARDIGRAIQREFEP